MDPVSFSPGLIKKNALQLKILQLRRFCPYSLLDIRGIQFLNHSYQFRKIVNLEITGTLVCGVANCDGNHIRAVSRFNPRDCILNNNADFSGQSQVFGSFDEYFRVRFGPGDIISI